MNLFSIRDLCWAHGDGQPFFRHLTLDIPAGSIVSVHGDSGCGKTTLVQILGMLWDRQVSPGQISLNTGVGSRDYASLSASDRDAFRRDRFGFVLQNSYLIPHFSCSWNMALPRFLAGLGFSQGHQESRSILSGGELLPGPESVLLEKLESSASKISQGQRQRFNILRALSNNPSIVFADEPTSNLDHESSLFFFDVLKRWQSCPDPKGDPRSLIVISHNLEHAYNSRFLDAQWFIIMRHPRRIRGADPTLPSHDVTVIPRSEVPSFEVFQDLVRNRHGDHR